jgi:hypothetical protein
MRKKPILLLAILISTILVGVSVPAYILANRAKLANFTEVESIPIAQAGILPVVPADRDTDQVTKQNCTYHAYHWEAHPEAWPAQVNLGGVTYTRADMLNLRHAPDGDPAIDLLKEAMIAIVNIYNGASQARIESVLVEANDWLSNHQADSELSEFNQQQARSFTSVLAKYNNGLLFPASCEDQIPLPSVELASKEVNQSDQDSSPSPGLTDSTDVMDKPGQPNSGVNYRSVTAQPTPLPTSTPTAQDTIQTPKDTPATSPPGPRDVPPDNRDEDNSGTSNRGPGNGDSDEDNRGRGNGNPGEGNRGRGNDNPGEGNQGRGNDSPGEGNRGRGNDNPGEGNRGRGNDNPGEGNQGRGNDNPGEGNQGRGNDNPGEGNQGRGNDNPGEGNSGRGNDNPGEGNHGRGNDNSGKDEEEHKSGKDKGKDKDKGDSGKDKGKGKGN